jgi:hypothetical protein
MRTSVRWRVCHRIPSGAGFLMNSRGEQRTDSALLREALLALARKKP